MNQEYTQSNYLEVRLISEIIFNLVTHPEDVEIQRQEEEDKVILSVRVNSEDMGIVIGRNGSMAGTIKTLMRAIGRANDLSLQVEFLEPDGTSKYPSRKKQSKPQEQDNNEVNGQTLDQDLEDFVIN
jgi:hypothetical protein